MAAENWEKNLIDILSHTDDNISSLKSNIMAQTQRYQSPRSLNYHERSGEGSKMWSLSSTALKTPARRATFHSENISFERSGNHLMAQDNVKSISSNSKKFNEMEMKIESLNRTVSKLQYENKVQNEDIKYLKGELKHVRKRLSDKGVHLSTEIKMKEWQLEMRSELDEVNKLMKAKLNRAGNTMDCKSLSSLSKELKESERILQDVTDSNRRESDNLRTRIMKLENDIGSIVDGIRDTSKEINYLKNEIRSTKTRKVDESSIVTDFQDCLTHVKDEISELRIKVVNLQCALETNAALSSEAKNIQQVKNVKKDTAKFERNIIKDEEDKDKERNLNLCDADISILSSDFDDVTLSSSVILSNEDEEYLSSLVDDKLDEFFDDSGDIF